MQAGKSSRLSQVIHGVPDVNSGESEYVMGMDLSQLSISGIADLSNKLLGNHAKLQEANIKLTEILNKLSVLLAVRYNKKLKNELQNEKKEIETKLAKIEDNEQFIQEVSNEKRRLTKQIKQMDETLNNRNMLQREYEKRNRVCALIIT